MPQANQLQTHSNLLKIRRHLLIDPQPPYKNLFSFFFYFLTTAGKEDEKLLHLSMELKKNRSNANAIHDIIANLKSSLLELNRNLENKKIK